MTYHLIPLFALASPLLCEKVLNTRRLGSQLFVTKETTALLKIQQLVELGTRDVFSFRLLLCGDYLRLLRFLHFCSTVRLLDLRGFQRRLASTVSLTNFHTLRF